MLSKRKQVVLAVAGSVGIHLLALFAWALSVQWFPHAEAALSKTPEEIKLEVVQETPADTPPLVPDEVSTPTPTPKLAYKDTDDLPEAKEAPKDAAFQSDRNAEAASELPATGDKPLPTQKGRPIPSFAFDSHPYTPGDEGQSAGQNVPENMPPVPQTAPPPPRAVPKPLAQVTPPPPVPTATPAATVADPRELAMLAPQSIPATPAEAEPNPYDPSFRPPTGMTEPPLPTPVPRRGGYQPQQLRTEASGGIEKTGAASVASEATPGGRYTASALRTIGHRWRQFTDARTDLVTAGTVTVRFTVDRDGKVHSLHVVSNTANEALASISLRAVADAPIPPMPEDAASSFSGAMMPVEIHFNLDTQTPY